MERKLSPPSPLGPSRGRGSRLLIRNPPFAYSLGYAPYAAGLYVNNRYGVEWLTVLGACLCGISAGIFWATEAAIAIAYPEPWNRGRALGWWLTFRLMGQITGGAINIGLNADRDGAGKVSYSVYLVFIALQAAGPLAALFLTPPHRVQRRDGVEVDLAIHQGPWHEIKMTAKNFVRPKFLLVLFWIGQSVFAEAVFFTYLARDFPAMSLLISFQLIQGTVWFSVRARALGSFLGGVTGIFAGNALGVSRTNISGTASTDRLVDLARQLALQPEAPRA